VADLDHRVPTAVGPRADADLVPLRLALGDRVRRVQQQVQEDLPQARLVALDHRRVAVVLHQPGAVPDLVPGDVDRRIQYAPQRDGPALLLVTARKTPQVARDVADALGALTRLGQRLPGLVQGSAHVAVHAALPV